MNNKGTSFFQYFVFLIVLAIAAFFFLPDTVPFPLGGNIPGVDMNKMTAQMAEQLKTQSKTQPADSFGQTEKEIAIPQEVYDSIPQNPAYQEYLLGNKKHIVILVTSQAAYLQKMANAIDTALAAPDMQAVYTKNMVDFPINEQTMSCNGNYLNCPGVWLARYCMGQMCIINPSTRRMVSALVISEGDVAPLLEKYKNW